MADRLKKGERVLFGPMPGDRYEWATVLEDEPEPIVRIRYDIDGKETETFRRKLSRRDNRIHRNIDIVTE